MLLSEDKPGDSKRPCPRGPGRNHRSQPQQQAVSRGLGGTAGARMPPPGSPHPEPTGLPPQPQQEGHRTSTQEVGSRPLLGQTRRCSNKILREAQIMQGPKVWQSQWGPEAGIVPPYSPQPLGTALKSRERGVTSCAGTNCVELGKTEEWAKRPHLGTL